MQNLLQCAPSVLGGLRIDRIGDILRPAGSRMQEILDGMQKFLIENAKI